MKQLEDEPRHETRQEAAEAGRVKFICDRECQKCRSLVRYTSSRQCVDCSKSRVAKYVQGIRRTLRRAKGKP